ncbi:S1/P1 nuclease [Sphingobium chlorophenolicum L-1]|uniref:S1/P1 nuclease n=1 Tax=Sphingobium chlorophenolicum L-1 TaxID=690566 RepID=F6EVA9_SPHCR|nr:S1/P1 nuclease [Sphingobium chlorophenolicum]AEG49670.1 S1/P1 nuclease [Sphingobium chlorophenolicum L-1]
MRFSWLFALPLLAATPVQAWGPVGHRITGAIADRNLSGAARAQVQMLLGVEDLAEAATWPDDMKSDPAEFWRKTASPWHYVTVGEGDHYSPSDAPKEGDAITALKRFTATLRDARASVEDRRLALRFVVHILGDLHQPLHAGGGGDRGGNDVKVTFFGQATNLHSVWDSGLIEQRALSYSEHAAWLSRSIAPRDTIDWSASGPATWLRESIALRKTIYPADPDLSWDYVYRHRAELDDRLRRGGVRIAAYLNAIFDSTAPAADIP